MKTYQTILSLLLFGIITSCSQQKLESIKIEGEAQGTTYQIIYFDEEQRDLRNEIDSLFKVIDKSMSLWDTTSIISRWNSGDSTAIPDVHFMNVLKKSIEVAEISGGAFDPTVGPLVNAWGFGAKRMEDLPLTKIDSLLELCGYQHLKIVEGGVIREKQGIQLDFNAIAQGYTVDVISDLLLSKGINDFLVEVGGEMRTFGAKPKGEKWKAGIDKPIENESAERELQAIVTMEDRALATSGNYRAFYEKGGQKYSHTIDPKTGYPVQHNLLSASVLAADCMTADAYATVLMVIGTEKAMELIGDHPELEAFLIYSENGNWKTWMSPGLQSKIEEIKEK